MKIENLTGLSKPLTRLIEVISQGIGAVSRPYLIKRNAEAKAHEVRVISDALDEVAKKNNLPAVFRDGAIEIWSKPEDRTLVVETPAAQNRSDSRERYQARVRQKNVESITSTAAEELSKEREVPNASPDADWVSRFFRAAEDISSEQMQELWGRVLAGEIRSPGSYSLKTLEVIKNLSSSDAALLEKLANLAVSLGGASFIAVPDRAFIKNVKGIYPSHHFDAGEIGALYPSDITYNLFSTAEISEEVITSGDIVLVINKTESTAEIGLPVWKYTSVGREILSLIDVPGDERNMEELGQFIAGSNATVRLGRITERLPDGRIKFDRARTIGSVS